MCFARQVILCSVIIIMQWHLLSPHLCRLAVFSIKPTFSLCVSRCSQRINAKHHILPTLHNPPKLIQIRGPSPAASMGMFIAVSAVLHRFGSVINVAQSLQNSFVASHLCRLSLWPKTAVSLLTRSPDILIMDLDILWAHRI